MINILVLVCVQWIKGSAVGLLACSVNKKNHHSRVFAIQGFSAAADRAAAAERQQAAAGVQPARLVSGVALTKLQNVEAHNGLESSLSLSLARLAREGFT
eukprot:4701403-Amphidinium_carterae.1